MIKKSLQLLTAAVLINVVNFNQSYCMEDNIITHMEDNIIAHNDMNTEQLCIKFYKILEIYQKSDQYYSINNLLQLVSIIKTGGSIIEKK